EEMRGGRLVVAADAPARVGRRLRRSRSRSVSAARNPTSHGSSVCASIRRPAWNTSARALSPASTQLLRRQDVARRRRAHLRTRACPAELVLGPPLSSVIPNAGAVSDRALPRSLPVALLT